MAGLAEFRAQHPEYNDMGDVELADALHAKFYADMPRQKFDSHLGLKTSQAQGFMKGASRVVGNLQPVESAVSFSPAGLASRGVEEIGKWVGQQERQGVRSGGAGETAGEFAASVPTMFVGGPLVSGALQGYASSRSDNLLGKASDAALGAFGGKVGSAVVGKVANTLTPIVEPAVQRLASRGVKMTPGQIRGGKAMVKEDKMMSRPVVGDTIAAGRRASIEGFNRAAVDEALAPLGIKLPANIKTGHDAVGWAHDMVSSAYNKVVPTLSAQVDQQFMRGMQQLRPAVAALPEAQQKQLQGVLGTIRFGQGGGLAGKKLQDALSEIGRLRSSYGSSANAGEREMARVLGDMREELMDMLVRQNPKLAAQLKAANKGFRGLAIVEDAASRADEGVFATGQFKQSVRRADASRRKNAVARRGAYMQDLSEDARAVLPAKVPDSGTAGRLQQGSPLANVKGVVSNLLYRGDQAAMQAFAKLPPAQQAQARNLLSSLSRPAGLLGAFGVSTVGD